MRLHRHIKAGFIALLLSAAGGKLLAQTENLPTQDGVIGPHADSIPTLHPGQLDLASGQPRLGLDGNYYAAKPVSIHTQDDTRLELGMPREPLQSIAVPQS